MKRVKYLPTNPNKLLMLLLGLWTILNIFQGIFTELANDEAYYWFITGSLSWGFFDHPPLFGLLTWLGVNTVGESEIGIRLFTILLQPIYLYLFWLIVRTEKSTWKSALTYFLIAFSIPQLQLYGWVVTPDAPLLMATSLVLWSYHNFRKTPTIIYALLIGLSVALLAYAKYQGALIVLLILLSDLKLMRNWRIWLAAAFAALLMIPHLWWQYDHDWVSFRYHLSDRNGVFAWGDVFEYLLNLLATFNPLLFVPFIIYMYKRKSTEAIGRALRFIAWGFMGFFLLSTLRGYVQPQWVIPMVFSMLYILTRAAERNTAFRSYVIKVGGVMVVLLLAVRLFAMNYTGDLIKFEIFNNHKAYQQLSDEMDGRTLIFDGGYAQASKMNYYSDGFAFAHPSIYNRSSQYQMLSMDDDLYGKPVAVAVNTSIRDRSSRLTLDTAYHHFKIANSMEFYYDTINYYIPTRRVEINYTGLPEKSLINQPIVFDIEIHNPYPYSIPTSEFKLIGQFKSGRFLWYEIEIPWKDMPTIPANDSVHIRSEVIIPKMNSGNYKFGFTLQRPPATSWYNSPRREIHIINPSQKQSN